MRVTVAMVLAMGAAAALPARDLPVPADKGWMHAQTRLILRSRIAGLKRTALTDATTSERDVAAQLVSDDGAVLATLYLFHPATMSVPLWFDRAQAALAEHQRFEHASPGTADPIAFAPPGASVTSALRQSYSVLRSDFRSTAVAMLPLGEWLVAIRMSARTLTADQLDARLMELIAELKMPPDRDAPAAMPVRLCDQEPAYTRAKPARPDGADMLMSLVGAMAVEKKAAGAPPPAVTWCRAGAAKALYGVYRGDPASKGYLLALQDAGRVVNVMPSILSQMGKSETVSVTLTNVDGTTASFPSYASLPRPEQVMDLISHTKPSGATSGSTLFIGPGATK